MAFIFYDTETTGTNTSFDQILQFAAIKTDDSLNAIDSFNIRCRLLPHVVPSPAALLVTGVNVADLTAAPFSHFEMMRQVRAKMNEWCADGAIFVGWNSLRFDESMLRQAYYQSLLPVYQTNTNGNGRADVMRMVQVASACLPNCLNVPLDANGKLTFRLGLIAEANDVHLDHAHEALADTGATLNVARLLRQRAPAIWDALIANARKSQPLRLIENNPVLVLSETFGGSHYTMVVAPIAVNAANANEWAVFDLQFEPANFLDASDDDLRAAINGTVKAIRRLSVNAQPRLLPLEFAPEDVRGGCLPNSTYQDRARQLREHPTFRQRLRRLLGDRYADQPAATQIEQRIYDGFPSPTDEARMASFHQKDWDDRAGIVTTIDDDRYRQLGHRIIAAECPQRLTAQQLEQWRAWRRERLLTTGDTPWLTVPRALKEIEELIETATAEQRRQLVIINDFLTCNVGTCPASP